MREAGARVRTAGVVADAAMDAHERFLQVRTQGTNCRVSGVSRHFFVSYRAFERVDARDREKVARWLTGAKRGLGEERAQRACLRRGPLLLLVVVGGNCNDALVGVADDLIDLYGGGVTRALDGVVL